MTRRSVLTLAGACLLPLENLYAREFWEKKDPSQWNGEEIDQLTTKSPWAKSVTAQYAPGSESEDTGPRSHGGAVGPPVGGAPGGAQFPPVYPSRRGGGGMRRPGAANPLASPYKGTVRWESAQPILDALKTPLPDAFANLYVIATRDIPYLEYRQRTQGSIEEPPNSTQTADRIKHLTILQVKGKDAATPKVVQQMTAGGSYFLYGFDKDALEFGKKDREIDFSTQLGRLTLKAKFDPSEMLYHGILAV